MPHFLLSHAPGEDEIFVRRFFDDLSSAVRAVLGLESDWTVGYRQSSDPDSAPWPVDERSAVARCRTFVALCTARYFLSDECGRNWGVFAARVKRYELATGERPPALIPVIWSADDLPEQLPLGAELGLVPFGGVTQPGVSVLIRLQRHRARYETLVRDLAVQVVHTGKRHRIPRWDGSWSAAEDVFARLSRHGASRGSPIVRIAVLAGTRGQMEKVRANLEPYGEHLEDWAPYRPAVAQSAVERACSVVAERRLAAEVVPVAGLIERGVEETGPDPAAPQAGPDEILVLLVDPWSTQHTELADALRDLRAADDGATVLVAMSQDDPETVANRGLLRTALRGVLGWRAGRQDLTIRAEPETAEGFDGELAVALCDAEDRLLSDWAGRRPSGPVSAARPILRGP